MPCFQGLEKCTKGVSRKFWSEININLHFEIYLIAFSHGRTASLSLDFISKPEKGHVQYYYSK